MTTSRRSLLGVVECAYLDPGQPDSIIYGLFLVIHLSISSTNGIVLSGRPSWAKKARLSQRLKLVSNLLEADCEATFQDLLCCFITLVMTQVHLCEKIFALRTPCTGQPWINPPTSSCQDRQRVASGTSPDEHCSQPCRCTREPSESRPSSSPRPVT